VAASGAVAQTTSTWNGTTGNWTDATRWSTPNYPDNGNGAPSYNAVINAGTVTLNQDITVTGFTMGGGGLVSPGTGGPFLLTANNTLSLATGSTIGVGQTVRSNGSATIAYPEVDGTFINAGTASVNALGGTAATVVNNLNGGSWTQTGNLTGAGTFNNAGTFATSAGLQFQWAFNNQAGGVVNITNGNLQFLAPGTHAGAFNLSNGGLQFEVGATTTFTPTSSVTGSGGMVTFGGTVTVNGTYNVSGTTWVASGGTITFNSAYVSTGSLRVDAGFMNLNQPTTLSQLWLNGGTLGGSGAITLNGTAVNMPIEGGTFGGTSPTSIQNLGTLMVQQVNSKTFAHNFNNASGAVINWNNGLMWFNTGVTLTNAAGGTFNANANFNISGPGPTPSDGTFDNFGTFTRGTGTGSVNVYSQFNNQSGATVNVQTGTLNLTNPGTIAGTFNVSAGAMLAFGGTETLPGTATFSGAGTLAVSGGTATISGPLTFPSFALTGGTLTGTGALNVSSLLLSGGTVGRDLTLSPTGGNQFGGGTVSVGSGFTLTIPSGATLQATAGTLAGPGAVSNQGTLTKTGTGGVTVSAPFTNAPGAQVSVQAGSLSLTGGGTLGGTYTTATGATLNLAGVQSVPGTAAFTGAGTVAITGGTTTVTGSLTYTNLALNGGTLAGTGPITGGSLTLSSGALARDFAVNGTTSNTFNGGTLTVNSGFTLSVPSGATLQATAGTISGPGAMLNQGTLTKTGTGTVTITAPFTNAAGASVQVQSGTLALGGGTLDGSYSLATGTTLSLLAGSSVAATATISGAGQVTTVGAVSVAAGGGNTYSGGTSVTAGSNLLVTGSGPALGTGNATVASGGTLRLSDAANLGAGANATIPAGAVLGLEASFDPAPVIAATSAGVVAIDSPAFTTPLTLNTLGTGSMFLGSAGTGTYAAATLGAGAGSTYRLGGGGATLTVSGANVLTGANAVTVGATGLTGTVRITAANNYSGGTTLASGTLAVGAAGALGTGTLTVTGGTLQADGGPITLSNAVTLGGDLTVGGTNQLTLSGAVTLTANRTITVAGTGGLAISGNLGGDVLGRSLTVAGPGTLTLSGTNTFSGGLTINSGSVQTAGGNQALGLGNVTVNSGAALRQTSFANLGGGSSVRVNSGGVLGLDGNFPPSLDPASSGMAAIDTATYSQPLNQAAMGTGQMFLGALGAGTYNATTLGAGTGSAYRLGAAGGTLTFPTANVLTGFNSLLIASAQTNGGGTVVLNAPQDFQGNTTINSGGKLTLHAALTGPGTVFILPGGTLAGSAYLNGYVNLGGTVSPGDSPGALTFTNGVGFGTGSHYHWELAALTTAGPGVSFDQVIVGGGTATVASAAALDVAFTGTASAPAANTPFWQAAHTWPIVALTGTGTTSGPLAFQVNNAAWANAGSFATGADPAGGIDLTWTPTPVLATLTWTGATSSSWAIAANWSPAGFAASSPETQLTFGATPNAAMTNDLSGTLILNRLTFNAGAPAYSLTGNGLDFHANAAGTGPQIVVNSAAGVTITAPVTLTDSLTVTGSGNLTLGGAVGGAGGLTKTGTGALTLGNSGNSYAGGTSVQAGTVAVAADAALGSGPVTVGPLGTLLYTASATTARAFTLTAGTIAAAAGQTVTLNGAQVGGGYLNGPGAFATGAAGAQFASITFRPSVAVTSNSPADQFLNVSNGGGLTVAPGLASPVSLAGVTNQGSGTITVGAGSQTNLSDFQTYGLMNLAAGPSPTSPTQITNVGTTPLYFNGGSRTFISDAAHIGGPAYVDLHGQDAIVAGGLFVNNGAMFDSQGSPAGHHNLIADYGATIKGAGAFQFTPVTQNGGKFSPGNSPGAASFGEFKVGQGGVSNYVFQIDDATGAAGPSPDAQGHVSGWGLAKAVPQIGPVPTSGNFVWAADSAHPLAVAIDTLVNPTTVGTDIAGPMANFDPSLAYSWTAVEWTGSYTGPTNAAVLNASTAFDTSGIVNGFSGSFGWDFGPDGHSLALTYTPVPEPGTLLMVGAAASGLALYRRRRPTVV
jgi:autotransporter-associated beta strand protein